MRTDWLVAALLLSPITGLTQQSKDAKHSFVRGETSEAHLAHQVRHELVMLPYYGIFDDLAFSVQDSTISLFGAVTRPTLKSDAENVVKKLEGVTQVINNIEVLPLSPMDDGLRAAEYRAIYGDATIGTRYGVQALPSIHILVKNGNVTLVGVVASEADKNLINIRANGVSGVFSVTNNLQVERSQK